MLDRAARRVPPGVTYLNPLHPDRFAEDFVTDHLLRRPVAVDRVIDLLLYDDTTDDPDQDGFVRRRAIALMNGAATRDPVQIRGDAALSRRDTVYKWASVAARSINVLLSCSVRNPHVNMTGATN